jgi:uncharacterized membrane-anchored protein YitT (DUF2179 family)
MDEKKLNWMYFDLSRRGIAKSTYAPLAYQMAWKIGLNPKPPLFASFLSNFLVSGIYFGVFWGGFMWLFFWRNQQHMTGNTAILVAAGAGVMFGLAMATVYRVRASSLKLPDWEHYGEQRDTN